MRAISCVVPLLLASCFAAVPAVPSLGGPKWTQLDSEHFTMWTDASEEQGRDQLTKMEHVRQILGAVAFHGVATGGHIFVISLRDIDELHAFTSDKLASWESPAAMAFRPTTSPFRQSMIAIAADYQGRHEVDSHELTHAISYGVLHRQPHWFAEGLAQYFEIIRISDGDHVELGRPPRSITATQQTGRLMPISELFECQNNANCKMQNLFYSTSWALFTFLQTTRPKDLFHYEQLFESLPHKELQRAWDEAFPDLPLDKIDAALHDWFVSGSHIVLHTTIPLAPVAVTVSSLDDADVYSARALLDYVMKNDDAATQSNAAQAIAIDRIRVLPLALRYQQTKKIPADDARAATQAHAEDWRAWWLLALATQHGDEHDQARDMACALAARNSAVNAPDTFCVAPAPASQP